MGCCYIDHTDESDLNFINRISKRFDAVGAVKAGCLMLIRKGQSLTTSVKPLPTITIHRSEGDGFSYSASTADSYNAVKARWNSKSHTKLKTVVAGSGDNAKVLKETLHQCDQNPARSTIGVAAHRLLAGYGARLWAA